MRVTLFLLILFWLGCTKSYAQTIDGIAFKDLEYLEIVGKAKSLSPKQFIGIEYGQEKTSLLYPYKNTKIKDAEGNVLEFNYMIEALNFMVRNGFEFVQAYTSIEDEQSVYHYLLKKKKQD
ncbi:hypothetical protein AHMF7605_12775 [Adhaeribacter arboris]|uniref:Uncharacterized protein n=1 Tax=Adhaeribacter arboris TaxID=2072846 RepID=A0A2T2YFP0_9BACT|nr:hypothetical protein [Adhaeribacter arboris]PSR54327.1 hypothetical protein AHMF7605_12775 [Adhaeribacter arboris]